MISTTPASKERPKTPADVAESAMMGLGRATDAKVVDDRLVMSAISHTVGLPCSGGGENRGFGTGGVTHAKSKGITEATVHRPSAPRW